MKLICMKRVLVVSALIPLTCLTGHAQGTVDFRNDGITFTTQADRLVYGCVEGRFAPLVGTNFLAQLYWIPGLDNPNVSSFGFAATNTPAHFRPPGTIMPGVWTSGGYRTLYDPITGTGVSLGGGATLEVRVWETTLGNSWEEARASVEAGVVGYHVVSARFNYIVPSDMAPPDQYYMENFRAFGPLSCVPEPSSLALLSVASILGWLSCGRRVRGKIFR